MRNMSFKFATFMLLTAVIITGCAREVELPDPDAPTQPQLKALQIPESGDVKTAFFNQLKPVVDAENDHIMRIRTAIETLRSAAAKRPLTRREQAWLMGLAEEYRVPEDTGFGSDAFFTALLERVDVIPASLVLAQAALESGWGKSRFAREANNLFGHWCFKPGCGLVPANRNEGAKHEVARFRTVNESVRAYMRNLNRKSTYAKLRSLRADIRAGKIRTTSPGLVLAQGLENYSQLGKAYISHIEAIIRRNELTRHTRYLTAKLSEVSHDG